VIDRVAYFIATAGYAGRMPFAPGTAGSVVGVALHLLVRQTGSWTLEGVMVVVTLVGGIWSASVTERVVGRKDPGIVVVDEVLGMLVTLAFLDVTLRAAAVGFFLFRMFDVLKPFPAGRLEHLHGGFGVMMDDAVAGLYAHIVLRLLLTFRSEWFV
jgi:phosphatidylglycerophosphatase A